MSAIHPAVESTLIVTATIILSLLALYFFFLLCLCVPWIQRQSLYAHNIHTSWWHNLDDPEDFGFASKISSRSNPLILKCVYR
jgi:hypothetical protein